MRLINTTTLQFENIADSKLHQPENKYAVLSHRWGASATEEISFADIDEGKDITHKKGFAKFKGFCDLAATLGYRYCWDDTCCINKADSSEMSEAINSMYRWYQDSGMCIVYLEDVPKRALLESEWFDRGWTLQELIAPREASFYDRDWRLIGEKSELLLALSSKTGIPEGVLSHATKPAACSVAQRMSWAANRETTRVEDRAYSLLGIFGVSMPQIYGERELAFLRLQRAIMQQSKDESLFAWAMNGGAPYTGLLAPSPADFADCADVISIRGSTGFSEANGELSLTLRTLPHSMETYYAILNCGPQAEPEERIAILVSRLSTENEYVRVKRSIRGRSVIKHSRPHTLRDRLIRVSLDPTEPPLNRVHGFYLRTLQPPGHTSYHARVLSRDATSTASDNMVCIADGDWGTAGIVYFEPPLVTTTTYSIYFRQCWSKLQWLKLGFDKEFNPMIFLGNERRPYTMRGRPQQVDPRQKPDPAQVEQIMLRPQEEEMQATRDEMFNNRWIGAEGGRPGRSWGWPGGMSILRVDRNKRLIGALEALNLGISVTLEPIPTSFALAGNRASIRNTEEMDGLAHVWTLDLFEIDGPDPEKHLQSVKQSDASAQTADESVGCCCTGDVGNTDSDVRIRAKQEASRAAKVLGQGDLSKLAPKPV